MINSIRIPTAMRSKVISKRGRSWGALRKPNCKLCEHEGRCICAPWSGRVGQMIKRHYSSLCTYCLFLGRKKTTQYISINLQVDLQIKQRHCRVSCTTECHIGQRVQIRYSFRHLEIKNAIRGLSNDACVNKILNSMTPLSLFLMPMEEPICCKFFLPKLFVPFS